MNTGELRGNWHRLKGRVREQWGELTDDDVARINGEFEKLAGVLQHRLGVEREAVERQLQDWLSSVDEPTEGTKSSFVETIEDSLRETGEKMTQLRQQAAVATGELKETIDAEVATLSDRYEEATSKLARVKNSGEEGWRELAADCRRSWQNFKVACDTAWERCQS